MEEIELVGRGVADASYIIGDSIRRIQARFDGHNRLRGKKAPDAEDVKAKNELIFSMMMDLPDVWNACARYCKEQGRPLPNPFDLERRMTAIILGKEPENDLEKAILTGISTRLQEDVYGNWQAVKREEEAEGPKP